MARVKRSFGGIAISKCMGRAKSHIGLALRQLVPSSDRKSVIQPDAHAWYSSPALGSTMSLRRWGALPPEFDALDLPEPAEPDASEEVCSSGIASCLSPVPSALAPMPGLRGDGSHSLSHVRTDKLTKLYTLRGVLGKGGSGIVNRAKSRRTGAVHAVKSVPLAKLDQKSPEFELLPRLKHPHIVVLLDSFRDEQEVHLVLELCAGGSLLHRIQHFWDDVDRDLRKGCKALASTCSKGLPASIVGSYAWQMLAGLAYLHHHRLAHRDVKPENYMLTSKHDNAPLKLADFGLASNFVRGVPMTQKVGTLHYAAPEIFACSYDERCDVWSAGVALFMASVGYRPINGKTDGDTLALVKKGDIAFRAKDWQPLPAALKTLVFEMTKKDPALRPRVKEIVAGCSWVNRFRMSRGDKCSCMIA